MFVDLNFRMNLNVFVAFTAMHFDPVDATPFLTRWADSFKDGTRADLKILSINSGLEEKGGSVAIYYGREDMSPTAYRKYFAEYGVGFIHYLWHKPPMFLYGIGTVLTCPECRQPKNWVKVKTPGTRDQGKVRCKFCQFPFAVAMPSTFKAVTPIDGKGYWGMEFLSVVN